MSGDTRSVRCTIIDFRLLRVGGHEERCKTTNETGLKTYMSRLTMQGCVKCNSYHPVTSAIANFLPTETR